jgi:Ca2+-binding RTX toxin-like protein
LQDSVVHSMTDLHNSGAHVLTHIVTFNTNATDLGTYDLSTDAGLNNAIAAVTKLSTAGTTNYEAALQHVETWITSTGANSPLDNADINKVLFVSDGEPNTAMNNSGGVVSNLTSTVAMQHILGTGSGDTHSEVVGIESSTSHGDSFTIEAVGINVTSLNTLNQVEGSGGAANNVTTSSQLGDVVGNLTGSHVTQTSAGNDTIQGGDGNDIIFGDAPNTDSLADLHAETSSLPAGSGWLVFQQLGWSVGTIQTYIEANQLALSAESGRTGGNDTLEGGAGDDHIYGQEGADTIWGGTGHDTLKGGTGADTFVFKEAGSTNVDHILDYSKADGDTINLSALTKDSSQVHVTHDTTTTTVTVGTSEVVVLDSYVGDVSVLVDDGSGPHNL